jgi:hypothetical protein
MNNLKHSALRDRHWQQIINETHLHLDMNETMLTMENMIAMHLTTYEDIIQSRTSVNQYSTCHVSFQALFKQQSKNDRSNVI